MTARNEERVALNAYRGIGSGLIQMVISAVTMPMILHFGGGSASSAKGYFMAALVFSVVCIPCFWICFASTKEILGSSKKKESIGDTMKNLVNSFKLTFRDRNAVFLMLAMLTFLTGLFGRIGIIAYYFIYVMRNPVLIAGFATAMSAGTLMVNFYAPFLLNKFSKKYVGAAGCTMQALCCIFFSTKLGNAIGGSVGILVLSAVGYVANAENLSAEILTRMNMVINFARQHSLS